MDIKLIKIIVEFIRKSYDDLIIIINAEESRKIKINKIDEFYEVLHKMFEIFNHIKIKRTVSISENNSQKFYTANVLYIKNNIKYNLSKLKQCFLYGNSNFDHILNGINNDMVFILDDYIGFIERMGENLK